MEGAVSSSGDTRDVVNHSSPQGGAISAKAITYNGERYGGFEAFFQGIHIPHPVLQLDLHRPEPDHKEPSQMLCVGILRQEGPVSSAGRPRDAMGLLKPSTPDVVPARRWPSPAAVVSQWTSAEDVKRKHCGRVQSLELTIFKSTPVLKEALELSVPATWTTNSAPPRSQAGVFTANVFCFHVGTARGLQVHTLPTPPGVHTKRNVMCFNFTPRGGSIVLFCRARHLHTCCDSRDTWFTLADNSRPSFDVKKDLSILTLNCYLLDFESDRILLQHYSGKEDGRYNYHIRGTYPLIRLTTYIQHADHSDLCSSFTFADVTALPFFHVDPKDKPTSKFLSTDLTYLNIYERETFFWRAPSLARKWINSMICDFGCD
ncbi:Fibrohexamerin [Eumeta japonica]|uniref:Fibrohexamerin n=1 Tax=Eumeta variegata TaxID=151549 RepID=A0A4C1ZVJ8_EUMVA|nr:Fibrohexamerin [Eumeta japonica]